MTTFRLKPGGEIPFGDDQVCKFEQVCLLATYDLPTSTKSNTQYTSLSFDNPFNKTEIYESLHKLKEAGFEYITIYGNPDTVGIIGQHIFTATSPAPEVSTPVLQEEQLPIQLEDGALTQTKEQPETNLHPIPSPAPHEEL